MNKISEEIKDEIQYCDNITPYNGGKLYEFSDGRKLFLNNEYRICGNLTDSFIKIKKDNLYGFAILSDISDKKIEYTTCVNLIKWLNTHEYFISESDKTDDFLKNYSEIINNLSSKGYSIIEPKYDDVFISECNFVLAQNDKEFILYNALGLDSDNYNCFIPFRTEKNNSFLNYKKPYKDLLDYIIMIPNNSGYVLFDTGVKNGGIIDKNILDFMCYIPIINVGLYKTKNNTIVGYDNVGNYFSEYNIVNDIGNNRYIIKDIHNSEILFLDSKKSKLEIALDFEDSKFGYTKFFGNTVYIFDEKFNIIEKYDKKNITIPILNIQYNMYCDKNGKRVCSEKNVDRFFIKKIYDMTLNPEEYTIKHATLENDVNKQIYDLEDKINCYLKEYNNEKLNLKFEKMKIDYDNATSKIANDEILERKKIVDDNKENQSIKFEIDENIESNYSKYKNELIFFLKKLEDNKYIIEIIDKSKKLDDLINNPIEESEDSLLCIANELVNKLFINLNEKLKKKNIDKYRKIIYKNIDILKEYINLDNDEKCIYSSVIEWEEDIRKEIQNLIIDFKEDYELQEINKKIGIHKKTKNKIVENNNKVLMIYYDEICKISNDIRNQTNDKDILDKLNEYENYRINSNESFEKNKNEAIYRLKELVKLQTMVNFIMEPKKYDDYEPRKELKKQL